MAGAEGLALGGHHGDVKVVRNLPHPPPQEDAVSCRVAARVPLHNFSLPSTGWGSHRVLRCVKVDPRGASIPVDCASAAESSGPLKRQGTGVSASHRRREVAEDGAGGGGVEDGEGKAQRLRKFPESTVLAEFHNPDHAIPQPQSSGSRMEENKSYLVASLSPPNAEGSKPWNLRVRKVAARNAPEIGTMKAAKEPFQGQTLATPEKVSAASTKCSGWRRKARSGEEEVMKERPRFSALLSKKEIDEDFLLMTGSKPPRRTEKRPRNVQKQIDALFPGSCLREITPALYKTS